MKKILFYFLSLTSLIWFLIACAQQSGYQQNAKKDPLEAGFADPHGTARAKVYWWWLNGYTDSVRIKQELLAIKNAGLGGVDIFEIGFRPDGVVPAGPAFMGDESLRHIALAIREATRLGLEVGLNLSSSWNAGGSWITAEHGAKSLYYSKTKVDGSSGSAISLPISGVLKNTEQGKAPAVLLNAKGMPSYLRDVAVLAIPLRKEGMSLDTATIINVTQYFNAEREVLNWQVPPGNWEIYRYVCVSTGEQLKLPSPNSKGLIIDHFDSTATRVHFEYFITKLRSVLGDFSKTTLKNLYLASFEATGTIWTPDLPSAFTKLHSYDISKFLPALFEKEAFGPKTSAAFRRDFELTVSELMINNHYRKGREVANQYGLKLISESGGPGPPLHNVPVEGIKALGALDTPRGEFWINHARYDHKADSVDLLMLVKEISAASHIYQRKITELEAFTSFQNWQEGPGDMKPNGDRAFCEGMSRPVIHGFTHNPNGVGYPGIYYVAGTHFNDKTTWWPKVRPFNDYLARVSYIMQQTDFVADVLYYYGDQTPNFVTPKNTRFAVGSGYDYEIINTEILLRDLTVKDGLLTLPYGAQFRMLALGDITGKEPALLLKLEKLLQDGAIITGKLPVELSGNNKKLADKLWNTTGTFSSTHTTQKNISTTSPGAILKMMKIGPDFDYPDKQSDRLDYMHDDQPVLDYIHQRGAASDFYFVRNTTNGWITRYCSFRVGSKTPRVWNPVTGHIAEIPFFGHKGNVTEVLLTLPPYGSVFVEFGRQLGKSSSEQLSVSPSTRYVVTTNGTELLDDGDYEIRSAGQTTKMSFQKQSQNISGPWDIQFKPNWGAPERTTFPELMSWTQAADQGIRHYSGSGVYRKQFTTSLKAKDQERIYLDLGDVSKVADLKLNGTPLGIRWLPPFRYDVTDVLREGKNDLEIEVINTWSNRIIGDITSDQKFTKTNLNVRGSRELLWKDTPLVKSGLLGPVKLETVKIIR